VLAERPARRLDDFGGTLGTHAITTY